MIHTYQLTEIPDFTGYYADKNGNIYTTLKQGCRNRFDLSKRTTPKLLNIRLTKNGYSRVYMRRDSTNKREDVYIHRIIAELFIPNPNNLEEVNHINCIRNDNRVENLEWVSRKENLSHAMNKGFMGRNKLGQFENKQNL